MTYRAVHRRRSRKRLFYSDDGDMLINCLLGHLLHSLEYDELISRVHLLAERSRQARGIVRPVFHQCVECGAGCPDEQTRCPKCGSGSRE